MIKKAAERMSIGARITLARERHGMSQNQLAKQLEKTRAAISLYEKNEITPRPKVFAALAKVFDADPEWFERGEGKAPDPRDVPVIIPEINVAKLTNKVVDLRELSQNRPKLALPASSFRFVIDGMHRMVAIRAPNPVASIDEGDRVVINAAQRRRDDGVFLVIDRLQGPQLRRYSSDSNADGSWIVGRVVAHLRTF